jgi:hypothetical protein
LFVVVDLSLDPWHILYWREKLIERYGYQDNGMMSRSNSLEFTR